MIPPSGCSPAENDQSQTDQLLMAEGWWQPVTALIFRRNCRRQEKQKCQFKSEVFFCGMWVSYDGLKWRENICNSPNSGEETLADVYRWPKHLYFSQCRCLPKAHNCRHQKQDTHMYMKACACVCSTQVVIGKTWFHTLTSALLDPPIGRYNPNTDSWSTDVAPLSSPRSGVCLVEMDGYLYAIGGHDGIAAINTVERYWVLQNIYLFSWYNLWIVLRGDTTPTGTYGKDLTYITINLPHIFLNANEAYSKYVLLCLYFQQKKLNNYCPIWLLFV